MTYLLALVVALCGISNSQVSVMYSDIDVKVQCFLNRQFQETGYVYVLLGTYSMDGLVGVFRSAPELL